MVSSRGEPGYDGDGILVKFGVDASRFRRYVDFSMARWANLDSIVWKIGTMLRKWDDMMFMYLGSGIGGVVASWELTMEHDGYPGKSW